jgi:hypothetical protein
VRASVVTWRLLFHMLPTPMVLEEIKELIGPVADIQMPDYDPRRYDDGLHEVILVEPPRVLGAGEIALNCLTKAHRLLQRSGDGLGWGLMWPRVEPAHAQGLSVATSDKAAPESLDGFWGVFNPTYWGSNPYDTPIAQLYGASFAVRVLP